MLLNSRLIFEESIFEGNIPTPSVKDVSVFSSEISSGKLSPITLFD